MDKLALHLLGGFAVERDGHRIDLPPACQRVVAVVALRRRPVHRLWVCATLWPNAQTRRAITSLRSAMWRLRPLGIESLLTVDSQYLQLGSDVAVDWHEAVALIEQLRAGTIDPQPVIDLLALLRAGELLDGWSEPWVAAERERYHAMRTAAFEMLGHVAENQTPHVSCTAGRAAHTRRATVPIRRDVDESFDP